MATNQSDNEKVAREHLIKHMDKTRADRLIQLSQGIERYLEEKRNDPKSLIKENSGPLGSSEFISLDNHKG